MIHQALQAFKDGGWVMYPLLFLSIASLTLILERAAFWTSMNSKRSRTVVRDLIRRLSNHQPEAAKALAQSNRSLYARFARDLLAGDHAISEAVALESIEHHRPAIERFATSLTVIVAAAPLLGILGTVTGVIQTFGLFGSDQPITDPTMLAAGIAEALYTTAYGLTIAIVTLWPHAIYRTQASRCFAKLEAISAAIVTPAGSS